MRSTKVYLVTLITGALFLGGIITAYCSAPGTASVPPVNRVK